jgi:hypothetical protein
MTAKVRTVLKRKQRPDIKPYERRRQGRRSKRK